MSLEFTYQHVDIEGFQLILFVLYLDVARNSSECASRTNQARHSKSLLDFVRNLIFHDVDQRTNRFFILLCYFFLELDLEQSDLFVGVALRITLDLILTDFNRPLCLAMQVFDRLVHQLDDFLVLLVYVNLHAFITRLCELEDNAGVLSQLIGMLLH